MSTMFQSLLRGMLIVVAGYGAWCAQSLGAERFDGAVNRAAVQKETLDTALGRNLYTSVEGRVYRENVSACFHPSTIEAVYAIRSKEEDAAEGMMQLERLWRKLVSKKGCVDVANRSYKVIKITPTRRMLNVGETGSGSAKLGMNKRMMLGVARIKVAGFDRSLHMAVFLPLEDV